MTRIGALGPTGTFSQLAASDYLSLLTEESEIRLYPTIGKAFSAVGKECDCAVLPIENMAEGYVSIVLDLLVPSNLVITHELILPIQFSLAANCARLEDVTKVYAQFVTQGQCERFLDKLNNVAVITTHSNGASLEEVRRGTPGEAAIVPAFTVDKSTFPLVIENIADRSNNMTRFIAVGKDLPFFDPARDYKTTILVIESTDRPGVLSDVLQAFATRGINLVSIMSRPTKEMMGRYHFFIDVEGHSDEVRIREALEEVKKENTIKLLGAYPKAELPSVSLSVNASAAPTETKRLPSLGTIQFKQPDPKFPEVFVGAGKGPYENTVEALRHIDLSVAAGKRILLKPNAGRVASPDSGVVTNPQVVAAVIDVFKHVGASVDVGESPITGVKALDALESSGIGDVARQRGCRLIDLDARRYVTVSIPDGVAVQSLKVCPEVLEYDAVVSIPVMKTHMHTGVTLAVKNMKGCLWRRSKVDLHMLPRIDDSADKSLNIAITDMSSVLRPHLSVVDGTIGMEGLGPSAGKPKALGVVVAGVDAFAVDAVACRLMGYAPAEIPHLRLGAQRGYGIVEEEKILVSPSDWKVYAKKFEESPRNVAVTFKGVRILDEQSCSACQSTLLLFLKRYGEKLFDYFPKDTKITMAIGKGHDALPEGTLCIGNCTARHKNRGLFISGCPPVSSEILKALGGLEDCG